eukprot:1018423-Amphidinium_carterae.2
MAQQLLTGCAMSSFALKEARLARDAESVAQKKAKAEAVGLCWAPPRMVTKMMRPSRSWKQTFMMTFRTLPL